MNKINSTLNRWLIRAALFLPAGAVLAVETLPDAPIKSKEDIAKFVTSIFNWMSGIVFTLGVIAILIAAITYMAAPASPEAVKNAKLWLLYAIIGIGIALLAQGVKPLLLSFFTV